MHVVDVIWDCEGDFAAGTYSRAHRWVFDGGVEVAASASPSVVPLPHSRADAVDPEEAYVAALSSCHMLWFLDLARQAGHAVAAYRDHATGKMMRSGGRVWIPRVDLNIRVVWAGQDPGRAAHEALHHKAHDACFIANSVKTEVITNIVEGEQA